MQGSSYQEHELATKGMIAIYKLNESAIRQLMIKNAMTIRAAAKTAGLAETTLRRLLGEPY